MLERWYASWLNGRFMAWIRPVTRGGAVYRDALYGYVAVLGGILNLHFCAYGGSKTATLPRKEDGHTEKKQLLSDTYDPSGRPMWAEKF